MCGIAGWIDNAGSAAAPSALARMTDALAHRGPDGEGGYFALTHNKRHSIALGHRRLAIIDPVGGIQPMISHDEKVALIFNGEIYNFQSLRNELRALGFHFETNSDTEVLLNAWRAWGTDCLRRLRGMFAFALWDSEREMLLLARDHFGKKPLFFSQKGERILFASEIKALLSYPGFEAQQDMQSIQDYLLYRYAPAPFTMFEGITKLMPGSYALWHKGEFKEHRYALPPDGEQKAPQNAHVFENPIDAFTKTLDESVSLRMISDVPFGAFLSGGIDSSAIVALMSRHSQLPINTFSVGFKEAAFDETNYARLIAEKFKTNHQEWKMEADDIIRLLPEAIRFRDAPIAEPTDVAVMVLARLARQTVKMVLTGEGSDEILAGYPKHRFEPLASIYQKSIPVCFQDKLIEPLSNALPARFYRQQTLLHALGLRDIHERYPRWFGAIDKAHYKALAVSNLPQRSVSEYPFETSRDIGALRKCLYFDQTSWLPDNLLERGDRMTMAASIEARMPFMDYELAKLVSTLPDRYRIRHGKQKWILREAMRDMLPSEILTRKKVGFKVPVSLWFQTKLKDYVREHLLGASSRTRSFYNADTLGAILKQHEEGSHNHEKLIWTLLSFELFQREYRLSF